MAKPTYASVTEVSCTCGYLERAANDPATPIEFDRFTHEYQFVYPDPDSDVVAGSRATLIIYHCPFCGGAAPVSRRDLLFAPIDPAEERRLKELLGDIRTIDDALRAFGQPELDCDEGLTRRQPETKESGPWIEHFRSLLYTNLSETVDVHITDHHPRVMIRLSGKYIGPPEAGRAAEPSESG